MRTLGCLLALVTGLAAWPAPAAIVSYADVRADASLRVGSRIVRLYGIHVPRLGRTCRSDIRPVKCGSRAVLALDFKIRGFVRCEPVRRNRDRSVSALCTNRGVDLAAYLLRRGWAVALPGGPFEYHVLERIARTRNFGMWGMTGTPVASSPGSR